MDTCSGARSVLNEFKRIAMRADKTDQSFNAISISRQPS
jgi:hypothetical protein